MDYFVMVIALLTDFGYTDYFAGAMKGVIISINPEAVIVDISHSIPRHDIESAAFCIAACYRDFPPGTVFVCVVDPGVGSERRGLAVSACGKYFVAPDNGLLTHVIRQNPDAVAVELENPSYFRGHVANTFHGRDIFAPIAAHLSAGVEFTQLGQSIANPVMLGELRSERLSSNKIGGSVIYIDGFGNIVTSIPVEESGLISAIEIAGRKITLFAGSYEESPRDTLFFIEGSAGFIEISMFGKSAADHLHSLRGDLVEAYIRTGGSA